MRLLFLSLSGLVLWLSVAGSAAAQRSPSELGATSSGLCGLVHTGAPTCATGLTLSGTSGYGVTTLRGTHHRLLGNLGLGYVPLPWLAISLELVGRLDLHPKDERGSAHMSATGDPWLRGRVGFPVGRGVALGGELGLWLPGNAAPSYSPKATTVDLKALLSWNAPKSPFTLLGLVGARIDNSANSAPRPLRLRYGDQIALGLSDSHALLAGIGLAYAPLPALRLFGELSGQILVGKRAPGFMESPLRVAAGARYFLGNLALEATVIPALSQRPSTAPNAALVPIEPRVTVLLGVRYEFLRAQRPSAPANPIEPVKKAEPEPRVEEQLATLRGALRDERGKPVPDATVTLTRDGETQESVSQVDGSFSFAGLRAGTVSLHTQAPGFQPSTWEVVVSPTQTEVLTHTLIAATSTSSLRCLVRSFGSEPLRAQVVVRDLAGRRIASGTTDSNGLLELPLEPGQYRVAIDATGYQSRRSSVQVSPNEVAILNVDLRERQ